MIHQTFLKLWLKALVWKTKIWLAGFPLAFIIFTLHLLFFSFIFISPSPLLLALESISLFLWSTTSLSTFFSRIPSLSLPFLFSAFLIFLFLKISFSPLISVFVGSLVFFSTALPSLATVWCSPLTLFSFSILLQLIFFLTITFLALIFESGLLFYLQSTAAFAWVPQSFFILSLYPSSQSPILSLTISFFFIQCPLYPSLPLPLSLTSLSWCLRNQ